MELKILQKMYDLILYIYPVLVQFPRSEKFAMVAEIKRTCFEMLRLITRANKEKQKIEHLRKLDANLRCGRYLWLTIKDFIWHLVRWPAL